MSLTEVLGSINVAGAPSSWRKAVCYTAVELTMQPRAPSQDQSRILPGYEELMADVRDHGHPSVAALTEALRHLGYGYRVRGAARQRGAVAHPDLRLHQDLQRVWSR